MTDTLDTATMVPTLNPSSTINRIGYDPSSSMLVIEFKNGGTYVYDDVPRERFEALHHAQSPGAYHATYIKKQFKFIRLPNLAPGENKNAAFALAGGA